MDILAGRPRPEDGTVLAHSDWHNHTPDWAPGFPHGVETSFVLPHPSHELYLLSRGSYQRGKLRLKQHAHQLSVTVRVAYHDPRALARATVCRLHKGGNRNGVGIYTPAGMHSPRDRLQCDVLITLPDGPLHIPQLTCLTSNFTHEIANVWQSLHVDTLELATSNAPIRVKGITIDRGTITSSNGPIEGHFNACDLSLHTSNAGIQASVTLFSTDFATLDMRTSNGHITSAIVCITDGTGSFDVQARSSNGPVDIRYEEVMGKLVNQVSTSNASAEVVVPGFEGTFDVATSNARARVRDLRTIDPTNAGRQRRVDQHSTGPGHISGQAGWGRSRGDGRCVVHTSNASVSLEL